MRLTMMPAVPVPPPMSLLALLTRARHLVRTLHDAVHFQLYTPELQSTVLAECCLLLGQARHAASSLPDDDLATFYIELLSIFRGANRFAFEEAGMTFPAPGHWGVDGRRVKRQVWAYPQMSRLFLKTVLRESLEPLVDRWACRVELHR